MNLDSSEITRALRLFFRKGDIFEIRVLDAVTIRGSNSYMTRPHVESGYFDYNHIDSVPGALDHIQSARGVYFTPNPVMPELLARCANRIQPARDDSTTKDNHIVERRWFLVDCDVDHNGVSGISSSEEEHALAIDKAGEIAGDMTSNHGWPVPFVIDTGNGASLMYMLEPNQTIGNLDVMVSYALAALQKYDCGGVKIDPTVKNLARIWRLPGTMNCKGDNVPERPHRMARLHSVPTEVTLLGMNQLEELATEAFEKERASRPQTSYSKPIVSEFRIEDWIATYCRGINGPVQSGDQRKWFFEECPFGAAHSSPQGAKDTYIGQFSSGAFYFKCSHSHCKDKDWHALRDLLEPDWRSKSLPFNDPDVNIDGITGKAVAPPQVEDLEDIPDEELKESGDFIPFPEKCYDVHGIVKDVMDTTLKYASFPNRPLALAGALALMSILCAQKVETDTQLHPNIYILALAGSGVGKEKPLDIAQDILKSIGMQDYILHSVASGEGLEDEMTKHPAKIWFTDEFYSVLHDMMSEYADRKNTLARYLLTLYSNTQYFVTRAKSGKEGSIISNPHLTMFATTTQNGFFENIGQRFLNDGMFARLNIVVAETPKTGHRPRRTVIPDDILNRARMWRDFNPPGSGNLNYQPMEVPMTAGADECADAVFDEQNRIVQEINSKSDVVEWKAAAWNRFFEITMRYALIYACSEAPSPDKTVITKEAVEWASAFVRWEISNKIRMTENRYYRNEFERDCESVIEFMKRWHCQKGNTPMPAWKFNRLAKALKDKKNIVENLISQKRLMHFVEGQVGHGRPKDIYWLPEYGQSQKKEKEEGKI